MSDIHADKKENMQWLSELDLEAFFGEIFLFLLDLLLFVLFFFLEIIGWDSLDFLSE